MRGRPARRQPGADRPDERRPQARVLPAARRDGLQGDRGRVPGREPDRLRLRPAADRGRPHPRRRAHPGADPVPRAPDRPHLRVPGRCQAGDPALLQLDLGAAAPGRVRHGPRRHRRHRHVGGAVRDEVRRDPHAADRDPLAVLAGELHGHRAGVRGRGVRQGRRRHRPLARPPADRQPAGDGRDGDAERVRRLDRVDAPQPAAPRLDGAEPAPAQRPRYRRRCRRSSATWPAPTASRAACSATASAPATSAW